MIKHAKDMRNLKIVSDLASCGTVKSVAAQNSVSRAVVERVLALPETRDYLKQIRDDFQETLKVKLPVLTVHALNSLEEVFRVGTRAEKLQAAKVVVQIQLTLHKQAEIPAAFLGTIGEVHGSNHTITTKS